VSHTSVIRGRIRENADIGKSTWFQAGGAADMLFRPEDEADLQAFLSTVKPTALVTVIGVGSNLLVRDGGIEGVVIRFGRGFNYVEILPETIDGNILLKAGSGVLNHNLAQFCINNGLTGIEFLSGIPGTVGGALAMNAGAYGLETKDCLYSATLIDKANIKHVTCDEIGYRYRGRQNFKDAVFTSGTFKVQKSTPDKVQSIVQEIQQKREETQPIRAKTGGSTFKNPYPYKAWELIDKAELRGYKLGDAMVSEKHCNFLINNGNATATEIENLGELIRKKVYEQSNVELEWEIKIIGRKPKS